MNERIRVFACLLHVLFSLPFYSCANGAPGSATMPRSAAWRETTETCFGALKEVKVYDYVVANRDWAVVMTTRNGKTVAGKKDGTFLPRGKDASVEAVSPTVTLPLVLSQVEWLKKHGKMHPEAHAASRREPSQGELEKDGDRIRIRYDNAVSFPNEVTIWRKAGERTTITYSGFGRMEEAASRAEVLRLLAPIR